MKKSMLLLTCLMVVEFSATAADNKETLRDRMIERFCNYAAIDSRSCFPEDGSATFTMTDGQIVMAKCISDDLLKISEKYPGAKMQVTRSNDNYVYVTIPASDGVDSPTIGISCHLDVTPEVDFGSMPIKPIVDTVNGRTVVRTDGTTLLGADDKCGCTIAVTMIEDLAASNSLKHGRIQFVFCPNEDIGMAAERIDSVYFNPDILFDVDGEEPYGITDENFTAKSFNIVFKGNDVHPSEAKAMGLGDALAAAAEFINYIPASIRPEHTEGREGYIHPFNLTKKGSTVLVECRVRYFDEKDGNLFDSILDEAVAKAIANNPNVGYKVVNNDMQYANVAYTIHPEARNMVEKASKKVGFPVEFISSRGGTTASMFAVKGLKGGMCVFSGQHNAHSLNEYADLNEMEDAYRLLMAIVSY